MRSSFKNSSNKSKVFGVFTLIILKRKRTVATSQWENWASQSNSKNRQSFLRQPSWCYVYDQPKPPFYPFTPPPCPLEYKKKGNFFNQQQQGLTQFARRRPCWQCFTGALARSGQANKQTTATKLVPPRRIHSLNHCPLGAVRRYDASPIATKKIIIITSHEAGGTLSDRPVSTACVSAWPSSLLKGPISAREGVSTQGGAQHSAG